MNQMGGYKKMKYKSLVGPFLALFIPLIIFEYLRRQTSLDLIFSAPTGHFYIVSSVALLATAIGVAVGVVGNRLRNIKISFLSLAFVSLAAIFSIHGLSTPGFIIAAPVDSASSYGSHDHNFYNVPGITAQLSVLMAAFWLWLSSLSSDKTLIVLLARWRNVLVWGWIGILIGFAALCLLFPNITIYLPVDQNPLKASVTVIIFSLIGLTIASYYQSYRYSRFPLQLAIIYSGCLLIVTQYILVMGELWRLSWWLYHFLMLGAVLVMLFGLIQQYGANKSFADAIKALFTMDPVERITNSLSPSVKALVSATESRDLYTAGHNFRVTMYALRIAESMGLEPEQLRAVAQGTIVHDVGKINIPDSVLNKPGKLDKEERVVIEQHPIKGYEMCRNLGFMKEELDIIRSHHERWDGKGYPDGLKEEKIPILSRIVAVADVYDALTSARSYRTAWSHEQTLAFLEEHKGSHFDPACVDAWVAACKQDPEGYQTINQVINQGV